MRRIDAEPLPASRRRALIAEQIQARGEAEFADLAREHGVSEMTIRRDVSRLEEEGVVRRILGGAIAVGSFAREPAFEARASVAAEPKRQIARAVVDLLEPKQTVILDSGSTCLAVAREIVSRGLGLTILTPNVRAGLELASQPDTQVLLVGGHLRPEEPNLVGADAEDFLGRYNADLFIMGAAGIHAERGITEYDSGESGVKRAGMASAERTVTVADSTKLGIVQFVRVAPLTALHTIVTDAPTDDPTIAAAREVGVEIIHVRSKSAAVS